MAAAAVLTTAVVAAAYTAATVIIMYIYRHGCRYTYINTNVKHTH